jgi:hypothetical protein
MLTGGGLRPVSTPVISAAMGASLADEPGEFGPVATHPPTQAAAPWMPSVRRSTSPPRR